MFRPFVLLMLLLWSTESWGAERTLVVLPRTIELQRADARQGILVTLADSQQPPRDVTDQARFRSSHPQVAIVDNRGQVQAVSDGKAEIIIEAWGLSAIVSVTVRDTARREWPSFRHEIEPLLTKLGCNQGACHGKGIGQNGFRLSLRGYAPDQDYDWIVRESRTRRLNFAAPAQSLLMRKPLGDVPHGGGRLLRENSREAALLIDWIHAGAPPLIEKEPTIERLEILPGDRLLKPGEAQRLLVRAHRSDGRIDDVTWLSQIFSNDVNVVDVEPAAVIRAKHAGETAVRIHFEDHVEVVTFRIPNETAVDPQSFVARQNVIDDHVFFKLKDLRIPPAELCDDVTFLRRASLDIIGTLPTPDEVRAFLADTRGDKRARLIDALLARPEYVDYWTLQLCDLLQNRIERDHDVRGRKGVRALHAWVRQQVAVNRPWHELARDVLTAQGSSFDNPAVGYYIVTVGEQRPAENSEVVASVAQAFLGTRIGCAKCHNHPLERYTQDDYYHFAAFFSHMSLERQKAEQGPTTLVVAGPRRADLMKRLDQTDKRISEAEKKLAAAQGDEATQAEKQLGNIRQERERIAKELADLKPEPVTAGQPRTGQRLLAQPLDRSSLALDGNADPRVALVDWMTRPDNESFSGNMVNRLWKHFMAVGLVEPVDDLRSSNPPSNPALWKSLQQEFVTHNYDLKHLIRLITTSRAYQLSSRTRPENERDRRFYSHYYPKRLPAEVLLDAISHSVGVPEPFPRYPLGLRAIQLPEPNTESYFLSLFGRSDRVTACACERTSEVNLPQLLHVQCGEDISRRITHDEGRLKTLLKSAAAADTTNILDELFLATLSRFPTEKERQTVTPLIPPTTDPDHLQAYVDIIWALLNTKDFAFNH